jgi:hypothetical protein
VRSSSVRPGKGGGELEYDPLTADTTIAKPSAE